MPPIPPDASPFHAGEHAVQSRLGVRERIEPWARQVVRDALPEQHRTFFGALPFVVVAARDGDGRPWATLLAGAPGFIASPAPARLVFDAAPVPGDALADAFVDGDDVGVLGIELHSRRRNRANGRLRREASGRLALDVTQSFGNCPQYISERRWEPSEPDTSVPATHAKRLDAHQRFWIQGADTLFIATGHRGEGDDWSFGMDASHRGGSPGFVEVLDDTTLRIPDYAGNNHFNTIGNLAVDPGAGLVFVDFEAGSLLQLTGRVEIDWAPSASERRNGIRRWLRFEIEAVVSLERRLPLRWKRPEAARLPLRVVDRIRESEDVTSFVLEATDGRPLPAFEPGQHLPVEVRRDGETHPDRRTYSLSGPPQAGRYRISVKREPQGRVSRHLHDALAPGSTLEASLPAGHFVLPPGDGPVVLVSAGVGITPMVAMLHALAEQPARRVQFVHGARDGAHHPLAEEVREAARRHPNARLTVAYSQPRLEDRPGVDFDRAGRIDIDGLARAGADADYVLCGPTGFLADVTTRLRAAGVPLARIHAETFGPAAGGTAA